MYDAKIGFYTSYRDELITCTGIDVSKFSEQQIKHIIIKSNEFFEKYDLELVKTSKELVDEYNTLDEESEKILEQLWKQ